MYGRITGSYNGSNGRYLADISLIYREMSAERINFFQIFKLYLVTHPLKCSLT
jgi:hypothetical protein